MIQIQHLAITHTKDFRELVHDLNLTIATEKERKKDMKTIYRIKQVYCE